MRLARHQIGTPAQLGAVVRQKRKELSLTQVELAELTHCSPRFIGELERGKPSLQLDRVLRVLAALGVRVELEVPTEKAT